MSENNPLNLEVGKKYEYLRNRTLTGKIIDYSVTILEIDSDGFPVGVYSDGSVGRVYPFDKQWREVNHNNPEGFPIAEYGVDITK